LQDILWVVRQDGETGSHRKPQWDDVINKIGDTIHASVGKALGTMTLSELLDETEKP